MFDDWDGGLLGPNAKAKCKQSNARSTMMKVSTPTLHLDGHLIVLTYQPLIRPHHRVTVRPSRSPSSQRPTTTSHSDQVRYQPRRWALGCIPLAPSSFLPPLTAVCKVRNPQQNFLRRQLSNLVCDGSHQTGQKRKQTDKAQLQPRSPRDEGAKEAGMRKG